MIRIVTDSTSNLPGEMKDRYNIEIVPLTVHFGEESHVDYYELECDNFYEMLKEKKEHPKTSQPSPEAFAKVYKKIIDEGDEIVSIHISSKLSGTIQSANIAAKEINPEMITVIDSKSTCSALAMMVIEAAKYIEAGKSKDEIIELFNKMIASSKIYFIVDTLEYLQKGGRIGKASELMGSLLNIKPILEVKNGKVVPFEKLRGTKKVYKRMADILNEFISGIGDDNAVYALSAGGSDNAIDLFLANIEDNNPVRDALISPISPVIGAHTGPGSFALSFIKF
jgi:DegV family protein with EDD domain